MEGNIAALMILIFASLLSCSHQQALQGRWKLINHADIKLNPSAEVYFQFATVLNQKKTIERQLTLSACYNLLYSYAVRENDISFSYVRIIDIPRKCLSGQITILRSKIDSVFYFTINGTTLKLFDPTGFAPFVFEKVLPSIRSAINGFWQTINVFGARQFTDIYVNGSHAILCKGQGVAFYNITSQNQIIFTIIKSKGCSSNEMSVLNALDTAVYYRIRDKLLLYLYDYRLSTVISANLVDVIKVDEMITFGPVKDQKNDQQTPKPEVNKNESSLNNVAVNVTNKSQLIKPSNESSTQKHNSQLKEAIQKDISTKNKSQSSISSPPVSSNSTNPQQAAIPSVTPPKDIPAPTIVQPISIINPKSNQTASKIPPAAQTSKTMVSNLSSNVDTQQNSTLVSKEIRLPQTPQEGKKLENPQSLLPLKNSQNSTKNISINPSIQTSQDNNGTFKPTNVQNESKNPIPSSSDTINPAISNQSLGTTIPSPFSTTTPTQSSNPNLSPSSSSALTTSIAQTDSIISTLPSLPSSSAIPPPLNLSTSAQISPTTATLPPRSDITPLVTQNSSTTAPPATSGSNSSTPSSPSSNANPSPPSSFTPSLSSTNNTLQPTSSTQTSPVSQTETISSNISSTTNSSTTPSVPSSSTSSPTIIPPPPTSNNTPPSSTDATPPQNSTTNIQTTNVTPPPPNSITNAAQTSGNTKTALVAQNDSTISILPTLPNSSTNPSVQSTSSNPLPSTSSNPSPTTSTTNNLPTISSITTPLIPSTSNISTNQTSSSIASQNISSISQPSGIVILPNSSSFASAPSQPLPTSNASSSPVFVPQAFDAVASLPPFEQSQVFGKWYFLYSSTSTADLAKYYLIVKADRKNNFIVYGGCNIQISTYQLRSNLVTFSSPISTRVYCPNNTDAQITTPIFQGSRYVVASNSQLVFYDKNLKPLLAFTNIPPN